MFAQGPEWAIEFYVDSRGNSPPLEFIDGLQPTERAKVYHYLRLLQLSGPVIDSRYATTLTDHAPLCELRPGPFRLLYFAHTGRRFIILHALRKKGRKLRRQDISTAERRMAGFLEREG